MMGLRSLKDHAGYLVIDHKDSPGITPADVAHLPAALAVGKGEVFETDTKQCAHCQRTVVLNPQRTRPRGYCAKCDHYICDDPICNRECRPIKQLLDWAQTKADKHGHHPNPTDVNPRIILTDV